MLDNIKLGPEDFGLIRLSRGELKGLSRFFGLEITQLLKDGPRKRVIYDADKYVPRDTENFLMKYIENPDILENIETISKIKKIIREQLNEIKYIKNDILGTKFEIEPRRFDFPYFVGEIYVDFKYKKLKDRGEGEGLMVNPTIGDLLFDLYMSQNFKNIGTEEVKIKPSKYLVIENVKVDTLYNLLYKSKKDKILNVFRDTMLYLAFLHYFVTPEVIKINNIDRNNMKIGIDSLESRIKGVSGKMYIKELTNLTNSLDYVKEFDEIVDLFKEVYKKFIDITPNELFFFDKDAHTSNWLVDEINNKIYTIDFQNRCLVPFYFDISKLLFQNPISEEMFDFKFVSEILSTYTSTIRTLNEKNNYYKDMDKFFDKKFFPEHIKYLNVSNTLKAISYWFYVMDSFYNFGQKVTKMWKSVKDLFSNIEIFLTKEQKRTIEKIRELESYRDGEIIREETIAYQVDLFKKHAKDIEELLFKITTHNKNRENTKKLKPKNSSDVSYLQNQMKELYIRIYELEEEKNEVGSDILKLNKKIKDLSVNVGYPNKINKRYYEEKSKRLTTYLMDTEKKFKASSRLFLGNVRKFIEETDRVYGSNKITATLLNLLNKTIRLDFSLDLFGNKYIR